MRGSLAIREKAGGSVPTVVVENRSRDDYIFLMAGEIISGGHADPDRPQGRGAGAEAAGRSGRVLRGTPSLGGRTRSSPPARPWCRNRSRRRSARGPTRAASGRRWPGTTPRYQRRTATGSLELALKDSKVADRLGDVRRRVLPEIPRGAKGFIFVGDRRALGAEFFGREELARQMLPKLLDAYAVDFVLIQNRRDAKPMALVPEDWSVDNGTAIALFKRVCRAGSQRTTRPARGRHPRARRPAGRRRGEPQRHAGPLRRRLGPADSRAGPSGPAPPSHLAAESGLGMRGRGRGENAK